jgi:hypothetical protein
MGSNDPGGVDESKYKQGTGKQVSTPRNDNSPQMCVLITEETIRSMCLGRIGAQSKILHITEGGRMLSLWDQVPWVEELGGLQVLT